jgi:hypothetical protein
VALLALLVTAMEWSNLIVPHETVDLQGPARPWGQYQHRPQGQVECSWAAAVVPGPLSGSRSRHDTDKDNWTVLGYLDNLRNHLQVRRWYSLAHCQLANCLQVLAVLDHFLHLALGMDAASSVAAEHGCSACAATPPTQPVQPIG